MKTQINLARALSIACALSLASPILAQEKKAEGEKAEKAKAEKVSGDIGLLDTLPPARRQLGFNHQVREHTYECR